MRRLCQNYWNWEYLYIPHCTNNPTLGIYIYCPGYINTVGFLLLCVCVCVCVYFCEYIFVLFCVVDDLYFLCYILFTLFCLMYFVDLFLYYTVFIE